MLSPFHFVYTEQWVILQGQGLSLPISSVCAGAKSKGLVSVQVTHDKHLCDCILNHFGQVPVCA